MIPVIEGVPLRSNEENEVSLLRSKRRKWLTREASQESQESHVARVDGFAGPTALPMGNNLVAMSPIGDTFITPAAQSVV